MDAGQRVTGMFLWVYVKYCESQERFLRNQFKDDPALTVRLVMRMFLHYGEQTVKAQLAIIDNHKELIINIDAKVTEYHKYIIAHQNKLKPLIEDMENNK